MTDRETLALPTPNVTSIKSQFFRSFLDFYKSQVRAPSVWVRRFLSGDVHVSVCSFLAESTFLHLHRGSRLFCRQRLKNQRQPTALKVNQHRKKKYIFQSQHGLHNAVHGFQTIYSRLNPTYTRHYRHLLQLNDTLVFSP